MIESVAIKTSFILLLLLFACQINGASRKLPKTFVDTGREKYFQLEKNLWNFIDENGATLSTRTTVVKEHQKFIDHYLNSTWDEHKYAIMSFYEWNMLLKKLMNIENRFEYFKQLVNLLALNEGNVIEAEVSSVFLSITENKSNFSLIDVFNEIELVMVKQAIFYRALLLSTEKHCQLFQSAQQFLYTLYTDIALTELKGYTMMEFSWMILRLNGEGNFTREAMLVRQDYHERITKMIEMLREVMRRADRAIWRCDPVNHQLGSTYEEVTRLLQGYIENEVEMSQSHECWNTCNDYTTEINSNGCFKDKFCSKQERCSGKIYNCTFIASDMNICQSTRQSPRRYEFIQYHKVGHFGQDMKCNRQTTEVDSWWRYLFWHCSYCFCLCDDKNSPKTDRYFNLREVKSNTKENKVVTGLRFVKVNRVFHLQIQEGQLLSLGTINQTSLFWKKVDNYTLNGKGVINGRDYHTLKYGVTSIDLDDINTDDPTFVVTGVRFRVLGTHLNLEVCLTEFDYTTGRLINPEFSSFWKSNDNTDVSGEKRNKLNLINEGLPTLSTMKSIPISGHNQYMDFVPSSVQKDLAQSTLPFIDIQPVISNPPVPLAGVGIFYKGTPLNGGFLAPKIITYDFGPHIQIPKIESIKEEDMTYNTVKLKEDNYRNNEI